VCRGLFDQVTYKCQVEDVIQMAIEMGEWNEVLKRHHSNRRQDARFGSHHGGSLSPSHNDTLLLLRTTFSPVLQQGA
jgi:hypothetical protein